ncbi:hypothetical protein R3P38DRAFT_3625700 [Favolaschia claudopus]|uniref:Transposase n=1 Tax=Favolaschia claudopus TaxID=2862362 RepID=A0AAW0A0U6_9AGAR
MSQHSGDSMFNSVSTQAKTNSRGWNPHQPSINREKRALCRVLDRRFNMKTAAIADKLGKSVNVIRRALDNDYGNPDDTREDEFLVAATLDIGIKAILIQVEKDFEEYKRKIAEQAVNAPRAIANTGNEDQTPPQAEQQLSPSTTHHSTDNSDILMEFIACVPLDASWYAEFKRKDVDEHSLRRLSESEFVGSLKDLDEVFERLFPNMIQIDRLLLGKALMKKPF